jgi:hypothetical protein
MSGYSEYEPDVLAADKAVRKLRAAGHRTRGDWLVVGKGLARVRAMALALARTNHATGKAYNLAHAEIMDGYPNLRGMDKSTRMRALRLYNEWDIIEPWLKQRSLNEMDYLTNPRTILEKFDQHHRPPPPPPSHAQLDADLDAQEGRAAFADEQQRQHRRTPEEDAQDMLERHDREGIERIIRILAAGLGSPPGRT